MLVIGVQKLPNSRHRPVTTLVEASPNALFEEKSKRPKNEARKPVAKDLVPRNSGKYRRRPPNGASSQRLSLRWTLIELPVAYRKCAGGTVEADVALSRSGGSSLLASSGRPVKPLLIRESPGRADAAEIGSFAQFFSIDWNQLRIGFSLL